MLPEQSRQLLTGYVDGELTTRQREQVLKLLQQSAEARNLLRKFQEDAEALRRLPPPNLERDLSGPVADAIIERKLRPTGRRVAAPRPPFRPWLGLAAAAAVILAVGLASYVYFAIPQSEGPNEPVANQRPSAADKKKSSPPSPEVIPERPREIIAQKPPEEEKVAPTPPTPPVAAAEKPKETPKLETPAKTESAALTAPVPNMDMFQPAAANVALPFILKLREIDLDPRKQEFRTELAKDKSFRLELPCRETVKAYDRLQAALKAHQFTLIVDQTAQNWLKQPRHKAHYVVYVEDLSPDELLGILQRLRVEDKSAEAKRAGDGQFDSAVLNAMTKADHKELTELIGMDPTLPPSAKPASPLGVDARKPLSDATADQVAQALTGQGGTPRPEPGKPTAKPAEHLGLVMTFNPVRPQKNSAEVKRFLDTRKQARTGTLHVLLVLRATS